MTKPYPNNKNRGQILVITSLVVVLLLMSTIVYVTETQKNVPIYHPDANIDFIAVKQAVMHTAVSALANISNGGATSILHDDLTMLNSAVTDLSYSTFTGFEATPSNEAPYIDGVWLDWGATGQGVSSILIEFALNSSGNTASCYIQHIINVTSSIAVNSNYIPINESQKQVTVLCTLFTENGFASADKIEYYYQQDSPNLWVQATTPVITNYGNGTYQAVFTTQNTTQINLPISVHCQDGRAVSIWTNTTSTQT